MQEVVDEQGVPGHALPAWLKHQLAQGIHTFNEALWRRQQASQLLMCTQQLVDQGCTVFAALDTAHAMVTDEWQSFFPTHASTSFAAFLEASGRSQGIQSLQQSCSTVRAFPSIPDLSSGRFLPFLVGQTVTRLIDALLSQVVTYVNTTEDRACQSILQPLISQQDRHAPESGDVGGGALQVLCAVPICFQVISPNIFPTVLWLINKASTAHSSLEGSKSFVPHITSVVCMLKTLEALLQPEVFSLYTSLHAEERYRCIQVMLPSVLERCALQHMSEQLLKGESQPETALQWSVAIAHDSTLRPQRVHAVVAFLAPLLDAMCAMEAACVESMLKARTFTKQLVSCLQQLQLARQHIRDASQQPAASVADSSFGLQLPSIIFLVQHIQELWTCCSDAVTSFLEGSGLGVRDKFLSALGDASDALRLQLHASEAHLLRTGGGTMPLPADADACDAWVDLTQLAAVFAGVHMSAPRHIMQTLGRAGLQLQEQDADGMTAEAGRVCEQDAAYVQAAARLACSTHVREMLVEGAALIVAATIQEDVVPRSSESSSFVCSVLSQTRAAALNEVQAAFEIVGGATQAKGDAHHREDLARPAATDAQRVLSQLEAMLETPVVLACMTAITASVANPSTCDMLPMMLQLQTVLRHSTCSHPLMSSMARVFKWCHEQQNPPPPNVLHAAWMFWHATASAQHTLLPDVTPVALASALPPRLADLVAGSTCPQPRNSVSMQLSGMLPLFMQHLLHPSGMTMESLSTHRGALAKALRSLLCLSAQHSRAAPAALQELARVVTVAAQTLSVFQELCGPAVGRLTAALAHTAVTLQHFPLHHLSDAVKDCATAAVAAYEALGRTVVPGLADSSKCLPVLLQCIQDAEVTCGNRLLGPCDIPPQLLAGIGHASAQMAAWRARLLLPPPGLDPAMVSMERQQHILYMKRTVTEPTLQVARMAQTLPLMPDQSALIKQEDADAAAAAASCAELERTRVPRPTPAQYDAVVSEAERCFEGLLQSARSTCMSIVSHTDGPLQTGAAKQALMQGYSSAQAVSAWCDSVIERFPLYADQLSPFILSMRDTQRGLAISCVALEQHIAAQQVPSAVTAAVLRSCLAFPLSSPYETDSELPTLVPLLDTAAATSGADVAAHLKRAMLRCLSQVECIPEQAVQSLPATLGVQLELKSQLLMLQSCALHCDAPGKAFTTLKAVHEALQKIIFLWRTGNDVREELQRREESLFQTKNERCVYSLLFCTDDAQAQCPWTSLVCVTCLLF